MSTISQINIPDLGDVDEVEVIEVCVEVGQKVESEDSIMILETDKDLVLMDQPQCHHKSS